MQHEAPKTKAKIIQSIIQVAKRTPDLRKESVNKHGGYNYVSIDEYYENIARIALDHGLNWHLSETASALEQVETAKGFTYVVKTTYSVSIMHEDGDYWPDYTQITVWHPLQGAQTAGSSLSYADKCFMRSIFKIATGEGDADETDSSLRGYSAQREQPRPPQRPPQRAPEPPPTQNVKRYTSVANAEEPRRAGYPEPDRRPEPRDAPRPSQRHDDGYPRTDTDEMPPTSAHAMCDAVASFLRHKHTQDELLEHWTRNQSIIKQLKEESEEQYTRLVGLFKKRQQEVENAR